MSIVIDRKSHDLLVTYCHSETESALSSDSATFKGYVDSKRTNDYLSSKKNSTVIRDSPNVFLDSTQEIDDSDSSLTDSAAPSRKRHRDSSSSDESLKARSRSVSPEITYGGSPVKYKLCKVDGTISIIKKSMSAKPSRRSLKCTDQDITGMLDSDSDDLTIFDPSQKIGEKIVNDPAAESRYTAKKLGTPSKTETPKREDVSLRIKLRRSTEQSNYKIEPNFEYDKTKCRTSTRSTKGSAKKCGMMDCDEDHSVHSIRRTATLKSPNKANIMKNGSPATPTSRRTRNNSKSYANNATEMKNLHNKENESDSDDCPDEDDDSTSSRGRGTRKITSKQEFGTPAKQSKKLDEVSTPSTERARRNTKLVNYSYDALASTKKLEETASKFGTPGVKVLPVTPRSARGRRRTRLMSYDCDDTVDNKSDNESDNDADVTESGAGGERRLAAKPGRETPRKQIKKLEESITPSSTRPRRNSKLVNYNYDALEGVVIPNDRKSESDDNMVDNSTASRRRNTRNSMVKEGPATPQKQMKLLDEPMTPKRMLRKSVAQKLGEATPKKTPRRGAPTQLEDEPPRTPTTATRRISKAVTPSMKNGNLTPSMSRRTANVGKPKTILEEARARLHVSAVPKSLPCREEEFNDIFEFLERKLLDNNGGCIYISGVPGTGKTATVNEAITCLKKCVIKGDLENFDFIEINGMKLSEPRQAYVQILKQVNGQTATWEQAYQILEKRFTQSTAKRPMTLLLVDELDLLCNKRQDVVYNLLDWPAKANAQLVVITIANTMDLPERVLMGRVTSRLGLTRLTFQPYNHKQLQEIVMARLKDSDAFKSEAIQLVARKVAAVSGDARRALDICRRATEIAELNSGKIVTMQDVNQALTEMIASAKVQAIKNCSQMERIFLQAVCAEVARTGVEEASFHNVYRQLDALCSFEGLKVPNITQTLGICARLGGNRLLLCEHSRTDTQQRILLNVSSDDIHFAMQTIDVS